MRAIEQRLVRLEGVQPHSATPSRLFEKLEGMAARVRAGLSDEQIAEMEAEASAQLPDTLARIRKMISGVNHDQA